MEFIFYFILRNNMAGAKAQWVNDACPLVGYAVQPAKLWRRRKMVKIELTEEQADVLSRVIDLVLDELDEGDERIKFLIEVLRKCRNPARKRGKRRKSARINISCNGSTHHIGYDDVC